MPQKLLSEQWAASGGGRIVDVREVRSVAGSVKEVCKYLMKGRFLELGGVHRVRSSQDFFDVEDASVKPVQDEDWSWRYSSASVSDWVGMFAAAVRSGRAVMWRAHGGVVFRWAGDSVGC